MSAKGGGHGNGGRRYPRRMKSSFFTLTAYPATDTDIAVYTGIAVMVTKGGDADAGVDIGLAAAEAH